MGQKVLLSEIIEEVKKAVNINSKIEILHKWRGRKDLLQVLQYAYHPWIEFVLPKTNPPFKKLDGPIDMGYQSIHNIVNLFKIWCNDPNISLSQTKREMKFIEVLETLVPEEAEILLQMKNRKIVGIPRRTAIKAFPELYPSEWIKEISENKEKDDADSNSVSS